VKDIAIFLVGAGVMLAAVAAAFWWWLGCDGWSFC
jgi:hypothetical protein